VFIESKMTSAADSYDEKMMMMTMVVKNDGRRVNNRIKIKNDDYWYFVA
jgi:hypothetical protein